MGSIEISILKTPKAALYKLPKQEVAFFILAGHIANEIESLNKLLIWILRYEPKDPIEEKVRIYHFLTFARIHAGKLFEAWKAITKHYYGSGVSKKYDPILPANGKSALDKLKKSFKKPDNVIALIDRKSVV